MLAEAAWREDLELFPIPSSKRTSSGEAGPYLSPVSWLTHRMDLITSFFFLVRIPHASVTSSWGNSVTSNTSATSFTRYSEKNPKCFIWDRNSVFFTCSFGKNRNRYIRLDPWFALYFCFGSQIAKAVIHTAVFLATCDLWKEPRDILQDKSHYGGWRPAPVKEVCLHKIPLPFPLDTVLLAAFLWPSCKRWDCSGVQPHTWKWGWWCFIAAFCGLIRIVGE